MSNISPWERVKLARNSLRPTGLDYILALCTDFVELHGDRYFAEDHAIVGGIAMFHDIPITVIAEQKGKNTKENIERNFAMPHPEGYRKALRLMKQAEKFQRPILCFIDTPGAFCGIGAEERGQGEAIANNLANMMMLKTPIISVVISEGGSGGALALGVADRIYMLENAIYSILSPEGFASILYKDASRAKEAAENMKLTADDLFELGVTDGVIKEPEGGVQKDTSIVFSYMDQRIYEDLKQLQAIDTNHLIELRYQKFRRMG